MGNIRYRGTQRRRELSLKSFFFLDTCEIVIFGLDIDKRLLLCTVETKFYCLKIFVFPFFLEKSRLNVEKEGIRIF